MHTIIKLYLVIDINSLMDDSQIDNNKPKYKQIASELEVCCGLTAHHTIRCDMILCI